MPDPCQLQVDAVAASYADIANLLDQLDAALLLLDERLAALADCREHNPGSGGGGEGFAEQTVKAKRAKEKFGELKKLFEKKK